MKKHTFLVASAVVCASASLFADGVSGDNVFGIMPVLSKASETIVAVPWCACSVDNDQPIAVSNIVKTANLTARDKVHVLSESSSSTAYQTWELTSGGDGVLYWQSVIQAGSGGSEPSHAADTVTATRGTAIRLYRQNPTNEVGEANAFYLFGQVGTNSTVTTTIAAGTSTTPAYTLIAPPGADAVDLLTNSQLTGCQNDDRIVLRSDAGINREYFFDSGWKYVTRGFSGGHETVTTNPVESITLQPGFGAWYISRSASAPTLTWKNVTHK